MPSVHRKSRALVALVAASLAVTALPAVPAVAQDAPSILVLPNDRAEFLPGAYFDFRVEVYADAMPEDLAVTVNGEEAGAFFGAEPTSESWTIGDEASPVQSVVWRDLMLPEVGEYEVAVTAGGATSTYGWTAHDTSEGAGARNVILFIADGMTNPMLTAARIISLGNPEGKLVGEFNVDKMDEIGLIHTSGIESIITDSANSAHTYNTGHKSAAGALGVYPDTSPDVFDDPKTETFAELLKRLTNKSVGIVTTAEIEDATPGAVFTHTRKRGEKAAIAADLFERGLDIEVVLGGGGQYMIPQSIDGSRRVDDRDIFAEAEAIGYTVVEDATGLEAALADGPEKLLGIFHSSNMNPWLDRNVYTDNATDFPDQPGLVDMTMAALEILGTNPDGFYLEVEAASVDKQMHPLDYERSIADLIEYDHAVGAAAAWVAENAPDTLIVVTADHGHGYDVYGTVDIPMFNAAIGDRCRRWRR